MKEMRIIKNKNSKKLILISFSIFLFFSSILSLSSLIELDNNKGDIIKDINNSPKNSGFWDLFFIYIDGNWSDTEGEDWCDGSGTWLDPYIIENVTINVVDSRSGVLIANSDVYFIIKNITIYNSEEDEAGIKLNNVTNGHFIDNNCSFNQGYGIYLNKSNNNTFIVNTVNNNDENGIYLENSDNNTFTGNFINNNEDDGINIYESNNNTFTGNTVNNNDENGIYLENSDNNNITGNEINNNDDIGIQLYKSNNNTIIGNSLIGNEEAISEVESYDNDIGDNSINDRKDNTTNEDDEKNNDDNHLIILTFFYIILIGSMSAVVASTLYIHKRKKSKSLGKKKPLGKYIDTSISFGKVLPIDVKAPFLDELFESKNALKKLAQFNDINITALSEDFLDIVDQFEWDGNEKEEFINEMLALSPSERKFILKEMLEKSNLDYN